MRFIVWVEIDQFYIAEGDHQGPQIVFRDDFVLDVCPKAFARGVHRGMPLRQAKAILHEGTFVKWEAEPFRVREMQWLDECIPFSDVIEPADQHAAWIDLSDHPDPLTIAEELIRSLSALTGLTIRSGIAASKWMAQLAVKYKENGSALDAPQDFLANIPVLDLLPVPLECRTRLDFLGYSRIGHVAKLPFAVLQEQFEEQCYQIAATAIGDWHDTVVASYPPASCMERFVYDGLADTHEVIQNGFAVVAGRLGAKLDQQSLEGNVMTVTLEYEEGVTKQFERTFSKEYRDADSILIGINLLVEKELTKPLISVRVLLSGLRKVKSVQAVFLDRTRIPRRLESTIRRVQGVFGDKSVRLGRDIQLPRRVRVLREWRHATGWR